MSTAAPAPGVAAEPRLAGLSGRPGGARAGAARWLETHPRPTRRDERWHHVPVEELCDLVVDGRPGDPAPSVDRAVVDALAGAHQGTRLVLVDGHLDVGASTLPPAGLTVIALADDALADDDLADDGLPGLVDVDRLDWFSARNQALAAGGVLIRILAAVPSDAPIPVVHVVHVATPTAGRWAVSRPRTFIVVEPGARATVIESHVALGGSCVVNATTSIDLHADAQLTYHRVETLPSAAAHVGHIRARLAAAADLHATSLTMGATTSRVTVDVTARGDRSTVHLAGCSLPTGSDHHDHHVTVEHLGAHTTSTQQFRVVAGERGTGSSTGRVVVHPATRGTVAHQATRALLLHPAAQANIRPWLEILAEDVQCTHAAAVGRLDDDALFYLRSRGIPVEHARRMLVHAFVGEVLDAIAEPWLRDRLATVVDARLADQGSGR